jgi:mitogen-activated protein kinase kinase
MSLSPFSILFQKLINPQAIVDGDPPDLPEEGYSPQARDFVRSCLHKIPKFRPTYSMLLSHPWLLSLSKPQTITEDDEDEEMPDDLGKELQSERGTEDQEVADWVRDALGRKREGSVKESMKPALHKAPLDSVSPIASPG